MFHPEGIDRRGFLAGSVAAALAASIAPPAHAAPYRRAFSDRAAWNIPVAGLPDHPESARFVAKAFRGDGHGLENLLVTAWDWTYAVYEVRADDARFRVAARHRTWGNLDGKLVPYSTKYVPSQGWWPGKESVDSQVILLDPATGREWDLWQVSRPKLARHILPVGSGSLVPGSYFTGSGAWKPSRGCGLAALAMLVRIEEAESGVIPHALSMPTRGVDKAGTFFAPATSSDGSSAAFAEPGGLPEGLRFRLELDDDEFLAWVATRPPEKRFLAATVGRALRDYGWFVTDNSGQDHLQFQDRVSCPGRWEALGLRDEADRRLLSGLLTPGRVRAVAPPMA